MTFSLRALPSRLFFLAFFGATPLMAQVSYRLPPKEAVDVLDTPPPPQASVSPDGQWMAITHLQGMPSISYLAVPMARLAGVRVNVRTNGPYDSGPYDLQSSYTGRGTGFTVVRLADNTRREIKVA